MVGKIGAQDGIAANQAALKLLDPAHAAAYDKIAATETTLKIGHNETIDFRVSTAAELASLRSTVDNLPFLLAPVGT